VEIKTADWSKTSKKLRGLGFTGLNSARDDHGCYH